MSERNQLKQAQRLRLRRPGMSNGSQTDQQHVVSTIRGRGRGRGRKFNIHDSPYHYIAKKTAPKNDNETIENTNGNKSVPQEKSNTIITSPPRKLVQKTKAFDKEKEKEVADVNKLFKISKQQTLPVTTSQKSSDQKSKHSRQKLKNNHLPPSLNRQTPEAKLSKSQKQKGKNTVEKSAEKTIAKRNVQQKKVTTKKIDHLKDEEKSDNELSIEELAETMLKQADGLVETAFSDAADLLKVKSDEEELQLQLSKEVEELRKKIITKKQNESGENWTHIGSSFISNEKKLSEQNKKESIDESTVAEIPQTLLPDPKLSIIKKVPSSPTQDQQLDDKNDNIKTIDIVDISKEVGDLCPFIEKTDTEKDENTTSSNKNNGDELKPEEDSGIDLQSRNSGTDLQSRNSCTFLQNRNSGIHLQGKSSDTNLEIQISDTDLQSQNSLDNNEKASNLTNDLPKTPYRSRFATFKLDGNKSDDPASDLSTDEGLSSDESYDSKFESSCSSVEEESDDSDYRESVKFDRRRLHPKERKVTRKRSPDSGDSDCSKSSGEDERSGNDNRRRRERYTDDESDEGKKKSSRDRSDRSETRSCRRLNRKSSDTRRNRPISCENRSSRRNRSSSRGSQSNRIDRSFSRENRSSRRKRSSSRENRSTRKNRSFSRKIRSTRINRSSSRENRSTRKNRSISRENRSSRRKRSNSRENRPTRRNRSCSRESRSTHKTRSTSRENRSTCERRRGELSAENKDKYDDGKYKREDTKSMQLYDDYTTASHDKSIYNWKSNKTVNQSLEIKENDSSKESRKKNVRPALLPTPKDDEINCYQYETELQPKIPRSLPKPIRIKYQRRPLVPSYNEEFPSLVGNPENNFPSLEPPKVVKQNTTLPMTNNSFAKLLASPQKSSSEPKRCVSEPKFASEPKKWPGKPENNRPKSGSDRPKITTSNETVDPRIAKVCSELKKMMMHCGDVKRKNEDIRGKLLTVSEVEANPFTTKKKLMNASKEIAVEHVEDQTEKNQIDLNNSKNSSPENSKASDQESVTTDETPTQEQDVFELLKQIEGSSCLTAGVDSLFKKNGVKALSGEQRSPLFQQNTIGSKNFNKVNSQEGEEKQYKLRVKDDVLMMEALTVQGANTISERMSDSYGIFKSHWTPIKEDIWFWRDVEDLLLNDHDVNVNVSEGPTSLAKHHGCNYDCYFSAGKRLIVNQ